jgi:hypothetical protein
MSLAFSLESASVASLHLGCGPSDFDLLLFSESIVFVLIVLSFAACVLRFVIVRLD